MGLRAAGHLAACLLIIAPGHAQDHVSADVLVDTAGHWTVDAVAAPGMAARFQPLRAGLAAGYTRQVHWVRADLEAPAPDATGRRRLYLEAHPPYLDDLRLYLPVPGGGFTERRAGDRLPFAAREHPYRAFVFEIGFDDARPQTVYLRLETTSSSVLVLQRWRPEQFERSTQREYLVLGLFIGLLLTAMAVNLHHARTDGDPLLRLYALHLAATVLFLLAANGLVAQFLLPGLPAWADHWTSLGFIAVALTGTLLYRRALDVDRAGLPLRVLYGGVCVLAVALLPAPFVGLYPEAARLLLPALLLVLLTGALRSLWLLRRGAPGGRWLLAAHLFGLMGSLSAALTLLGWLSASLWLVYGFQFGTAGTLVALQLLVQQRQRAQALARHRLAEDLKAAQARQASEQRQRVQQGRFMAMLEHELKTPLSVIQLRLQQPQPSAAMQQHARQAVADIAAIVERCATAGRLEDGSLPLRRDAVDLVASLQALCGRSAEPARVRLETAPALQGRVLHTDAVWWRTVVANLLDNALKYSPPGSPVRLAVAEAERDGRPGVVCRVDNAVGRSGRPDATALFGKYHRGQAVAGLSGSGLGLYVVHGLVQALGGSVRCLAPPDDPGGTQEEPPVSFELWLPWHHPTP